MRRCGTLSETHRGHADALRKIHTEIGNALMVRHHATAALGSCQDALQVSERFLGRVPGSRYLERDRGGILEVLGKVYVAQSG